MVYGHVIKLITISAGFLMGCSHHAGGRADGSADVMEFRVLEALDDGWTIVNNLRKRGPGGWIS
jgi:hypothetical protein